MQLHVAPFRSPHLMLRITFNSSPGSWPYSALPLRNCIACASASRSSRTRQDRDRVAGGRQRLAQPEADVGCEGTF